MKPAHNIIIFTDPIKMAFFFNFFGSSDAKWSETMRNAEEKLLKLARQKFGASKDTSFQRMDTRIPQAVVPMKKNGCRKSKNAGGEDFIMHGIKVTNKNTTGNGTPLVLLHGYAGAALTFYRNLSGLASHFGTVYALDKFGWGLSSRPSLHLIDSSVETTEEFFVSSLEAWRQANNITKMTLAGHSMGGYLSVAYAEKYPERVERLILLSPVGVPKAPKTAGSRSSSLRRSLVSSLWYTGTSPGTLFQYLPEARGRHILDNILGEYMSAEERSGMVDYLYANMMLPSSGESAVTRILNPMAFAYKPLLGRIPKLKIANVAFVYGDRDWMDYRHAVEVRQVCEDDLSFQGCKTSSSSSSSTAADAASTPKIQVFGVGNAGHALTWKNWEEFNSAVILSGGGELRKDQPKPIVY
jgi:cardiolipin-specific phospholipase